MNWMTSWDIVRPCLKKNNQSRREIRKGERENKGEGREIERRNAFATLEFAPSLTVIP